VVKTALSAVVGALAGLCVAFIAIIADRLISAWSNARTRQLGIA